ncbi:3-deoxy-7-phosphoheptulonate synthase [Planctomycetota bacterium]
MIVVMQPGCTEEQIQHVIQMVEEMGLTTHVIHGTNRTVVAAVGDKRMVDKGAIENAPAVEKIVPILSPYKVSSREVKQENSAIELQPGGVRIGTQRIVVIAGPCSVESRDQILEVAQAVKQAGGVALRGGAFKPRTSPYSFQGLAEKGLEYLAEAREQTGLAVVTEVLTVSHVELVARYADVLQVGARNMQNFMLLKAVGEQSKPVLLKRGMSATLEEFLLAAEYIINEGNPNVILCERGIRTFEDYCRNTLALSVVPAIKRVSHLPIMADPAHGTGHQYLIEPMSLAAVAAGADGLLLEVHPNPEQALTDAAQQINIEQFQRLMGRLKRLTEAMERTL